MRGVRGADRQPGEIRRSQNWIGGTRPGNASFVPAWMGAAFAVPTVSLATPVPVAAPAAPVKPPATAAPAVIGSC
jgi:hypothetical protein